MRIRGYSKQFLSLEFLFLWLLKGTTFGFLLSNHNRVLRLNCQNSLFTSHIFQLAFVSLSIPWKVSGDSIAADFIHVGDSIAADTLLRQKSRAVGNVTTTRTTTAKPRGRRKPKNLPQKQANTNNALLANIDFLTQLTNNKQVKNAEMDPLKCFPKALCGLSAESAAITRRRKNGLITDYIRLMKAVALNPSVMDKTLKKLKKQEHDREQDDATETEEDRDDDEDEDEEEDEEAEQRGQPPTLNKRTNSYGYGYGSISPSNQESKPENDGPAKKRTKRKEFIPKTSREFTKQWLQEKAHVERLLDDGFHNEETDATNWWAYEKEREPELEELVDWSGTKLDSSSRESWYTFGGKRKPNPPTSPERPLPPPQPQAPEEPPHFPEYPAPPKLKPPSAPILGVPSNYGSSGGAVASVGNFFRSLFGFPSNQNGGEFSSDPFFSGFQRSLPDGTPTVVTVDKTKEILTTAIEIGETLRSPNQCNSLFNGCRYQYIELLHVIDDIRQSLAKKGKDDFRSSQIYTDMDEENESGAREETYSSYGYKSSLSETSQAETLSPDYAAAASAVTQKNGRGKKKRKPSFRNEKLSSMSGERDTSVEIGSDEPTMYGSAQQNFNFHHPYNRHGHSHGPHSHRNQPPHYNHQHQSNGYQPSYQFEEMHIRQPKTIWGTILSWFGFQ